MPKSPIELLLGTYRRRLPAQLLLRPAGKFHVRGLARITGIPSGSLRRELRTVTESGLLLRDHAGNRVLYRANQVRSISL
jgi:DNA-binding IclR family transcriptional regulator